MNNAIKKLLIALAIMTLAACSSEEDNQLSRYIDKVKSREFKAVKPLPEFSPLAQFVYPKKDRRSPFQQEKKIKLTPNTHRPRQPLEQLSLTTLKFVGILKADSRIWGLIRKPDGEIARVKTGDYLGENFGKIININDTTLTIEEIVHVAGEWKKKMITFTLHENE